MLFRPMTQIKKIKITVLLIALIIITAVWAVKFYSVNFKAFRSDIEIYGAGEFVDLDGDFLVDRNENTKGYSIRVNKARLVDYKELMDSHNVEITEYDLFPMHKYCLMVELTVKNDGNESGYIDCLGMNVYDGALMIPVDYYVWKGIDDNFKSTNFRIRPDSEVTFELPFTAQLLDEAMNQEEVCRRLENDTLQLCLSEFSRVKVIEFRMEKRRNEG